jgi:DNA-binding transcriptional MerR regulator
MSNIPTKLQKRYYSIGEVAKMFDVSASLIRYWENEFDEIKPHKNSKGDRRFTPDTIEQIRMIYHLVKERGFTLNGAKQELLRQKEHQKKKAALINKLTEIREFLQGLKSS